MLAFDVLIRGRLTEAVDGLKVVVPPGRSRAQVDGGVVSLSWVTEAGEPDSVGLSPRRFEDHLVAGAILIVDSAQICSSLHAP